MSIDAASQKEINPDFRLLHRVLGDVAAVPAFLVWRPVLRGTAISKIPCDPATGKMEAPNSAGDRAVLTLAEAEAAAAGLRTKNIEAGIGVLASAAGIVALDLDRCVKANGTVRIEPWAEEIVGAWTYAELSPSGTGIRMLMAGAVPTALADYTSGTERADIGIYGPATSKFVTLTGRHIETSPVIMAREMPKDAERAIWQRFASALKDRPISSLEYSGDEGDAAARADILSGEALHEPIMFLVHRWARRGYSSNDIETEIYSLLDRSVTKTEDPDRWAERAANVPRWIKGSMSKVGSALADYPTQKWQAACQIVREIVAKTDSKAAATHEAAKAEVADAGVPRIPPEPGDELYEVLFGTNWFEMDRAERQYVHSMDAETNIEYARALRGITIPSAALTAAEAQLRDREQAREVQAQITALREAREEEGVDEPPDWLIDECPSSGLAELASRVMARHQTHMPGLAMSTALMTIGCLTNNSVVMSNRYGISGINMATLNVASTGSGKSASIRVLQDAARAVDMHVTSMPGSSAGIQDLMSVLRRPNVLMYLDEAAAVLKALGDLRNRGGHLHQAASYVIGALPEATGRIFTSPIARGRGGGDRAPTIEAPYIVLALFTTKEALRDSFSEELISGGFLGRHLMFSGAAHPAVWEDTPPDVSVPQDWMQDVADAFHMVGVSSVVRRATGAADAFADGALVRAPGIDRPFRGIHMTLSQQRWLFDWHEGIKQRFENAPWAARAQMLVQQVAGNVEVALQADTAEMVGLTMREHLEQMGRWTLSDIALEYAARVVEHSLSTINQNVQDMTSIEVERNEPTALHRLKRNLLSAITDPYSVTERNYAAFLKDGKVPSRYILRLTRRVDTRTRDAIISSLIQEGWLLDPVAHHPEGAGRPGKAYPIGPDFGV